MKIKILLLLICLSLLTPSLFGQTNAPADSTNAAPAITNTVSPFQQAVLDYQASSSWAAAQNVAKLSATLDILPATPAEARRHLVMGQTIFKAATSTNDFQQAYAEFYQASTNAPWVANIWNNMAVAAEAEARYDVATNCFQVYQDFKLSDADAQEAQDKVYEIQAKQKMQADKQAEEQKAAIDAANAQAAAAAEKKKKDLNGAKWRYDWNKPYVSSVDGSRGYTAGYVEVVCSENTLVATVIYTRDDWSGGRDVGIPVVVWKLTFEGSLEGRTFTVDTGGASGYGGPAAVTISEDGQTIDLKPSLSQHDPVVYKRE